MNMFALWVLLMAAVTGFLVWIGVMIWRGDQEMCRTGYVQRGDAQKEPGPAHLETTDPPQEGNQPRHQGHRGRRDGESG